MKKTPNKSQGQKNQSLAQLEDVSKTNQIESTSRSCALQLQQYLSAMNFEIPRQKLIQTLRANQIQFHQIPNKKKMSKVLIKSNRQSCIFRVQVGNLIGTLSLIRIKSHSKQFVPQPQIRGSFGTTAFLSCKKKSYAIKRIQIQKQKPISNEIFQIFIAKIASILGIGPQFIHVYGYDAILFTDSIQFIMERCETEFQSHQIQDELERNILRKSLKIFHSFNICHNDIKIQNIGWSGRTNNFVFLDFGFSSYNFECVGFKTLTNYKGTFRYVCSEMKKLLYLKSQCLVDLYYNDFYCLEMTIKELKSNLENIKKKNQFPSLLQPQISFKSSHQQFKQSQRSNSYYCELFSFFQLKYSLFCQNLPQIKAIVKSQNKLIHSFRKLILFSVETGKGMKIYKQIIQIYKEFLNCHFSGGEKKMRQSDQFLYNYTMKCEKILQQQKFDQNLSQFINAEVLTIFWGQEDRMEEIFYLINHQIASDYNLQIPQEKKQFIKELYTFIFGLRQKEDYKKTHQKLQWDGTHFFQNYTLMYREIMVQMFEYFLQVKKIDVLEQIHANFLLLDEKNRELAQIELLGLMEGGDPKVYILKNLQFFIGKAMIYNQLEALQISKNICNIQKILRLLRMQKKQSQLCKLCTNLIKLMKTIRYYCKIKKPIPTAMKEELIQGLRSFISQQLVDAVGVVVNFTQLHLKNNCLKQMKNIKIQSKYLRICKIKYFQINILDYFCDIQEINFQQIFSNFYFPISQIQFQDFNEKKGSLAFDFSSILSNHIFGLNLLEVELLFQYSGCQKFVENFLLQYFDGQNMDRIKNIKDLAIVYNCYSRVFEVFRLKNEQILQSKKIQYKNVKKKFAQMALRFLQSTYFFIQSKYYAFGDDMDGQFSNQELSAAYFTAKGLAKLALGSLKEAASIFLTHQCSEDSGFTHLGIEIFVRNQILGQRETKLLTEILYGYYQKCIQSQVFLDTKKGIDLHFYIPSFSTTLIQVLLLKKQIDRAYAVLDFVVKNLSKGNCFFYFHNHPAIFYFLLNIQPPTVPILFQALLKQQTLYKMSLYPGISLLIFYMFQFVQRAGVFLSKQKLRRTLILCAYGFSLIYSYLIIVQKRFLHERMFKEGKIGRTTSIINRFVFCQKQEFGNMRDNYLQKIKSRPVRQKMKSKINSIWKKR